MTKMKLKSGKNKIEEGVPKVEGDGSSGSIMKKSKRRGRNKKSKKGQSIIPKGAKAAELLSELLTEENTSSEGDSLQGFKVIKWQFTGSDVIHHLFIKRHAASVVELTKEKPPGRTLLCHNVPPYFSDVQLREIFRPFGTIGRILIQQKPTLGVPERYDPMFPAEKDVIKGFKVAYIVYTSDKHLNEILEANLDGMDPIPVQKKPFSGVQRWIQQYNRKIHTTSELETTVRKFMENFDKEEVRRKEMEKNLSEPDADGWVTVTRTGRRSSSGLVRSEAMENRLKAKKDKEQKHFVNISKAQMKESKTKHLLELKKKFEEDKQRVALLKQQRKFKPF